jgi:hypothetical protein
VRVVGRLQHPLEAAGGERCAACRWRRPQVAAAARRRCTQIIF